MPVPPVSDPVRFAYWVANVSGGLVTRRIEQRTDWGYDYNREVAGDFYRLRDVSLEPKLLNTPERPHPEILQGGNSTAARAMAGRESGTGTSATAGLRRSHRADRRRTDLRGPSRPHRTGVRPQRLPHRPRHPGRGPRDAPRDRRQGGHRGRARLP